MRARRARRILRGDALLDVALGTVLLLAAWDGLYRALGFPPPEPAVFAEIAGALLLGFAYLLWVAPDYTALVRRVAEAAAMTNGITAALIALWLASRPVGLEFLGWILAVALTLALAAMAYLEARLTSL
jgi:hypothetical protein